ncbi:MAG: VacJ family lipoprotein [Leptotrichiaceae bacterium]|nr:VacJ family lipoprotein [Leptotrichiaceae bacterium]MBP6281103.1 VacJ family lipoprotein [Leptotrichiaceae bacterium]MBP7739286.1 VacJ family lipoprotein [Leptotrichiaceae bacterium]MBP9628986.1 VacJ family lipoprotein [Leptotrichiaceae bacterium]
MNNKNIKLTFSLVLFLASISQAKVKNEKIEKYIDSEIIKEVNDNTFVKFVDGDIVTKPNENFDVVHYKINNESKSHSTVQDNYGIIANNMDYLDEEYIISSKVFDLTSINDSLEPFNRRMYAFNTQLDKKVVYPVSVVYGTIIPKPIRIGINNFFKNFDEVPTFVNSLLQLKPKKAVNALGRFTVNSTIGILGLTDPATKIGLKKDSETMGDTLGHYGVKSGSYLVLPILGPSTLRDGVGLIADNTMESYVMGIAEEKLFFDTKIFDKTIYGHTRPIVTGLNARSLITFRYGDLNSPFEYDLVRAFYYNFRKINIKK